MKTSEPAASINEAASRWLEKIDNGSIQKEDAEFQAWLNADPRHYVAYERLNFVWQRTEILRSLPPEEKRALLEKLERRARWEAWKERNATWWDWLCTPILLAMLLLLHVYQLYIVICRAFGWKPRRWLP